MNRDIKYNPILIENSASNDVVIRISGTIGLPAWIAEWFDEEAINNTKETMRKELESISNIKSKRITVEIDSFGGDVNHGLAIYNALRATGANITTKYTGWSASIATVIGMAGDTRLISDNGYILVHQASGGTSGTAEEFKTYAEWLESVNNTIANIYSEVGKSDKDKIVELMAVNGGGGKWIDAETAKEYGLVTDITKTYQAAAYSKKTLIDNKLPIDNIKFENRMENVVDKVLNAIGFKNDEALKAENETLKTENTNLKTQAEIDKAELQAKVDETTLKVETLEAEKSELNNQLTEKDAIIAQLQAEKDTIQASNDSLQAQIDLGKGLNPDGSEPVVGNGDIDPLVAEMKEILKG